MNAQKIIFDSAAGDGNKIAGFFSPAAGGNNAPRGIFQICHGMADHFGRYEEMVDHLNKAGWHVCGMDMLGHGATYELNKENDMPLGFFGAGRDTAFCILKDVMRFHELSMEHFGAGEGDKRLPSVLFGHSMGSFVVRNIYITPEYADRFDAYIFASTKGPEPAIKFGIFLAKIGSVFGMKRKPGKLLNFIAFSAYNKKIDDPKTPFDWVSSDEAEVLKYSRDPLGGFLFTCKGFMDMFTLIDRMQSARGYKAASHAPCLIVYGEDDPVSGYGKGARYVADRLSADKTRPVTVKNYGHYRHELHSEPVRYEYFKDVIEYINMNTEEISK